MILCVAILLSTSSCIKKYDAGVNVPAKGYLVVEGFINSDGGGTTIYLSRTLTLSDTSKIIRERKALVNIQGENNSSYLLAEVSAGVYTSGPVSLNAAVRYRIHIKTSTGQEYNSDYSDVRSTPAIDSVFWTRDGTKGVSFFVNTHDSQNKTRYYLWKYNETWEYHAPLQSNLKFEFGPDGKIVRAVFNNPFQIMDSTLFICYHSDSSTNIAISSSEKLSDDIIQKAPLGLVIPPANERLGVLYSLNVKQYAISKKAYMFYQLMQKNTASLGSIFDAQPSQVTGNIHVVFDSTEKVIGFVEVSQETQKRIFVSNSELPHWGYTNECTGTYEEGPNISSFLNNTINVYHGPNGSVTTSLLPTLPDYMRPFDLNGLPTVIFIADPSCVDCRLQGGTNKKPGFWP
jgi:hypothetical protein